MPGLISQMEPDWALKVLKIFRAASPGLENTVVKISEIELHGILLLKELLALGALTEHLLGGGVGCPVCPGAQEGRVYVVRGHCHH